MFWSPSSASSQLVADSFELCPPSGPLLCPDTVRVFGFSLRGMNCASESTCQPDIRAARKLLMSPCYRVTAGASLEDEKVYWASWLVGQSGAPLACLPSGSLLPPPHFFLITCESLPPRVLQCRSLTLALLITWPFGYFLPLISSSPLPPSLARPGAEEGHRAGAFLGLPAYGDGGWGAGTPTGGAEGRRCNQAPGISGVCGQVGA